MKNVLFLAFLFVGCHLNGQAVLNPEHAESKEYDSYGDIISSEAAVPIVEAIEGLSDDEKNTVKVSGIIQSVCKVKGCWMNVSDPEGAQAAFVKFQDYGFFVPKDSDGREVIMEGTVYKEVTSVEELRHYAEDDGKSAEEIAKITEPKEELKFMATGVLLKK